MKKHVKAKHPATRRPTLANSGQSDKEIWEALKDPNGSWTGVPDNPLDLPEQEDADDL